MIALQGDPESSETIRQTSLLAPMRDEEMVRPAWRHAERGRNDCAATAVVVTTTNGPKVSAFVALVKFGYMLENPSIPLVLSSNLRK